MAVVDSSAYRPGGRVHDVVTDTRPLLVTESLLDSTMDSYRRNWLREGAVLGMIIGGATALAGLEGWLEAKFHDGLS